MDRMEHRGKTAKTERRAKMDKTVLRVNKAQQEVRCLMVMLITSWWFGTVRIGRITPHCA
jgi:hypothetical protein